MMQNSTSEKPRIPLSAVQVAEAAKHIQDEFDSAGELRFAPLRYSEPLFGGDFTGPSSWAYHIRVFGNDVVRTPQLYLTVSNRSEHRLVRYDTATLPGGVALDFKHINFERESNVFDKSITAYTEHLGIGLTPKMLAEYIDKPMRIKVSNPREGVQFVVEVPSHYIAGVLYRLDPEKYDVEAAPVAVANDHSAGSTEPVDIAWLKKAGWIGLATGVVSSFLFSVGAGVAIGGFVAVIAAIALHKPAKNTSPDT